MSSLNDLRSLAKTRGLRIDLLDRDDGSVAIGWGCECCLVRGDPSLKGLVSESDLAAAVAKASATIKLQYPRKPGAPPRNSNASRAHRRAKAERIAAEYRAVRGGA